MSDTVAVNFDLLIVSVVEPDRAHCFEVSLVSVVSGVLNCVI